MCRSNGQYGTWKRGELLSVGRQSPPRSQGEGPGNIETQPELTPCPGTGGVWYELILQDGRRIAEIDMEHMPPGLQFQAYSQGVIKAYPLPFIIIPAGSVVEGQEIIHNQGHTPGELDPAPDAQSEKIVPILESYQVPA